MQVAKHLEDGQRGTQHYQHCTGQYHISMLMNFECIFPAATIMYDSGPRLGAGGGPPPAPRLRRYCHMNISATADFAAVENMVFTTVESFVIAIGICMTMFERSKHQD